MRAEEKLRLEAHYREEEIRLARYYEKEKLDRRYNELNNKNLNIENLSLFKFLICLVSFSILIYYCYIVLIK